MPLVESLVTALLRADGDALVMHVGERPYVVAANGPIDLSLQPLNFQVMSGLLGRLLPPEALRTLGLAGMVEHDLPAIIESPDRFTVVAARGADDLWIDVCRHRRPRADPPRGFDRRGGAPAAATSAGVAEVIPMHRARRPEQPIGTVRSPAVASTAERLLGAAIARGASTLYLTSDAAPFLRIDDEVRVLEGAADLSGVDVENTVSALAPEAARDGLRRGDASEWTAELPGIGRLRCSTFRDYRGPGLIVQLVASRPVTADQLGLTPAAQALATETDGLVLVAAPRLQGKTTVAAAFVDFINRRRPCYVVTLERQVRLVHQQGTALVSQRELSEDDQQNVPKARAVLRENADVLLIDEMTSLGLLQVALDAASVGTLVIATVSAGSAMAALQRVVELAPESQRPGIQALLAARFRGAVAQLLLHKAAGGRVAARELLLATGSVRSALAAGMLTDLPHAGERGHAHGLRSLNDALVELVRSGRVDLREAYRKAEDREGLLLALKRERIDLSVLERLA